MVWELVAAGSMLVAVASVAYAIHCRRELRRFDRSAAEQARSLEALAGAGRTALATPDEVVPAVRAALADCGLAAARVLVLDEPSQRWVPGDGLDLPDSSTAIGWPDWERSAAEAWASDDLTLRREVPGGALVACRAPSASGFPRVLVAEMQQGLSPHGAHAVVPVFAGLLAADPEPRRHVGSSRPVAPARLVGPVDSLTGLGTPSGFVALLESAWRRQPGPLALLLVALDGVDSVGGELGWRAGEEVVRIGARRLERCLRPEDRLARIDPAVFGVLLADPGDFASAVAVSERALAAIGGPVAVTGGEVTVEVRAGLVWDTEGSGGPGRLLPDAREALARSDGRVATSVRLGDSVTSGP